MPASPQIATLARALLQAAESTLLDLPLDALGARVQDEEVADVLRAAHEAGEAHCLRDLLDPACLAGWVEQTCTPREAQALCAQLRSWLGRGGAGDDDPHRLARVPALPDDPDALVTWAREHGLLGELMQPLRELWPDSDVAPEVTLLEASLTGADPEDLPGSSLLTASELRARARAYLRDQAARHVSLVARRDLWHRTVPEGPLRPLAERLRALLADTALEALHALRFVPAHPVHVDTDTGLCRARLRGVEGEDAVDVQLRLSGFEQRAIEGRCASCARGGCLHVRALAGRLLDACLDPDDRLHGVLITFAEVPSWKRFLQALRVHPQTGPAKETAERLSFRVDMEDGRLRVGAFLHTRLPNGSPSPGKLVSPGRMLRSPACRAHDRPVLEAMAAATRNQAPQRVPADVTSLRSLVEHPYVQHEPSGEPLRIREQHVEVRLLEQPEGLRPQVSLADAPVPAGSRPRDVRYLWHHAPTTGTLSFAPLLPELRRLLTALSHFGGVLPPESYGQLAPWLASLRQVAQVTVPSVLRGTEQPAPEKLLLRIVPGLDTGIDVTLSVRALPLGPLWPPGQGPELTHGLVRGAQVYARRDLGFERERAREAIEALGLDAHMRLEPFGYRIEETQAALAVLSAAARLGAWLEIEWAERARPLRIAGSVRASDLVIDLRKRGQWFVLEGGAQHGHAEVALGKLLEAAQRGERFVPIGGQDYVEIEHTLFERLAEAQVYVRPSGNTLRLPPVGAPAWLERWQAQTRPDAAVRAWLARARSAAEVDVSGLLPEWRERLRGYQQLGAAWLLQRAGWAPGACLADDMGLGKTLQTLAALCARASQGPALVVAPTSLVEHWQGEIARFAPGLEARVYRGRGRQALLSRLGPGQVLITSYDLLTRDAERFAALSFATQVVDEAQMVKNARTERARAVAAVQAQFRIALTGTPVENRLGDLWSLFRLIAPGLLGSWARFRALFAVPIERYDNEARAEALRSLVAPFVLRRTKAEVAEQLPSRTEVVHRVELSEAEQALYETAVREARRALGKRRRDGASRTVQVLAQLTRLRLLACHPRLVVEDERVVSSKHMALLALLDDILPRGHRVLLFSQFTRHLGLVRESLTARGIACLYLDGATPAGQRQGLVERFQAGEGAVFLISLKAGGTGLNLSAADYVVHLDPWWNPAAEDQASDRAHRIGQQRPLTIVKLVAQGTVEEKVLGLHAHKRRLAEAVLSGTAAPASLDTAELERLLAS